MLNWNNLPTEVINLVLFHIYQDSNHYGRQKTFSQCALTCRSWRMPAQVKKFSDIDFRTLKNIKKLSEMILNDQVSANWIKNVKFTCCSAPDSWLCYGQ